MARFRAQLLEEEGTMMDRGRLARALAAGLTAISVAGCGGGKALDDTDEDVGSLELLLSNVPSDVACLQVTLSGSRTVSKSFDLAPGKSAQLTLDRLPVGVAQVNASAFGDSCAKVKAASTPNLVLEKPVTARIDPLEVAKIC